MKNLIGSRRGKESSGPAGRESALKKEKAFVSFFNLKSIKSKLVLTFAFLIIIPVLLVALVSINTSSSNLIEKAKEILSNATLQTSNYYEITLKQISDSITNQILYNPQTTEYLNLNVNDPVKTTAAQKVLQDLVATYYDVINGGFILKNNNSVVGYPTYLDKDMELTQTGWAKKISESSGSETGVWLEDHSEGMPTSYSNDYVLSYGKSLRRGLIVLDIKKDAFKQILSGVNVGENAQSFIITNTDKIITPIGQVLSAENSSVETNPLLKKVKEYAQDKDSLVFTQSYDGESYITSFSKSKTTGWLFVTMMPESEITAVTRDIQKKILMLGIVLIIFAVLIGTLFSVSMTKSLKKLMDHMEETQKGDLRNVIVLNRNDEIGRLADGFNRMISQIKALVVQSKEASKHVESSSNNMKLISNDSAKAYTEIAKAIEEVATGSSNQAAEIQSIVASATLLADKINNAVNSTKLMGEISGNVVKMTSTGIESVSTLNAKAKETNEITENVVNVIGELNEYVKNIDKITIILKTIAEQTNLLALNAAIEAARAGESGKGFAVVADEVRKLAEQSNNSTREIQALIAKILRQTEYSVDMVNKAGATIMEQSEMVDQTSHVFAQINDATAMLTANIEEMLGIVADLDEVKDHVMTSISNIMEVTDQTAASAEEVSASTQEQLGSMAELDKTAQNLNNLAHELVTAMDKFKV